MQSIVLTAGWELKERDSGRELAGDWATSDGWLAAVVPGSTHEALLAAGRIPDPFYGLNELEVQWVGERDWLYRCSFDVPADVLAAGPPTLCFDGLDTFAMVWLNDTQVLVSDNMFVPARVPVAGILRSGRNELRILFESALRRGKEIEAKLGARAVWNGDPSRVYVRKAQYHYGWDWGPCLLTAGPWREVRIEAGARIAELHCPAEVVSDLTHGTVRVQLALELPPTPPDEALRVHLALLSPEGTVLSQATLPGAANVQHRFDVEAPQLWWPNGYGPQPQYRVTAILVEGEAEHDRREQRLGFRRLRLVQEALAAEPGTTFLFEINNTPIFCGGANWIPADSFTSRITDKHYRGLLQQAADARMIMLRVWGGGIYENDIFYDVCDELGLLVWQDFMFGCGMYPAHTEFQHSVRAEAEVQVRRLRNHPSVALWCGNNEDYQIAQSIKAYDASFDGDFTTTRFPAREIYERLLPQVCAELDPDRPYWPGSSYGGSDVIDPTVGDRHTWEVWHGPMAPYHDYPKYEGRFVSEFGMEACPALATIESVTPPNERYPQSRTLDHHNKSTDGTRRLAVYLSDTLRLRDTLEDYVYGTQLVQSEALAAAYRGWRRRWGGPGHYAVAGALVWQLDDCWPVTSWAILDYVRRPKPAYYTIRRELAPLSVGLDRISAQVAAWAVNVTTSPVNAELDLHAYILDGVEVWAHTERVLLKPNQATEIGTWDFEHDQPAVVAARLMVHGEIVARTSSWPEPYKYLALADPGVIVTRGDDDRLEVRVDRPAKGVWLTAGDTVHWSDNMLDLVPGDPQVLVASGLDDRLVQVQYLHG